VFVSETMIPSEFFTPGRSAGRGAAAARTHAGEEEGRGLLGLPKHI